MKTYTATPDNLRCNWFVIDATDKVLGRLATKIASYLRGKHKPEFTPHVAGDYIVVINADKLRVTGKKSQDKVYYHHSNYPGGIKAINFEDKMSKNPLSVLEIAVKGMLPKGPLGREMFRRLKVYHGAEHNHQAQQPQLLEWTD